MDSKMAELSASERWSAQLPQGLDVEISRHPVTMRRVVNLIIAMERLKAGGAEPEPQGTEFRDDNLLSIMLDSIVEEQIVCERSATPPPDEFTRLDTHVFNITDSNKKDLVVDCNNMELYAIGLQAGSENRKVILNMSTYVHPSPTVEGQPVLLGIRGTNLYLSCRKDNEQPTLHLEVVEDKSQLSVISADSEWARFLFYKRNVPVKVSTLMSARHQGWYISTLDQDNRPVIMSRRSTQCNQDFNMFAQEAGAGSAPSADHTCQQ